MQKILLNVIIFAMSISLIFAGTVDQMMNSCEKGNMDECYKAAMAYWRGEGIDQNREVAKSLLQIACDNGATDACKALHTFNKRDSDTSSIVIKTPPHKYQKKRYSEHIDGKLQGDIDNDGKLETIVWRKFASTDLGDYYQLIVLDDDASLLWEGPQKADEMNPLVFFELDTGISLPQVLADFDQDGNVELLAPMAQSDVSPTYYRKLRWTGNGFEALIQNALMLQKGSRTRFEWKSVLQSSGTWISKMKPDSNGLVRAEISRLGKDGSFASGEALIRFVSGGAVIQKVIVPISPIHDDSSTRKYKMPQEPTRSAVKQTVEPLPQQSNRYQAKIDEQDHYNSRGARLGNLISVLRQDRANYYKYGGNRGDSADRYFSTFRKRKAMEHMSIVPVGITYNSLRKLVLYGTPLLEIEVHKRELLVRVLER